MNKTSNIVGKYIPQLLFLAILTFIMYLIFLEPIQNLDSWKHLVDGRYIFLFGKFPHYSGFVTAPVRGFIPSDTVDWLGSVLLYLLYAGLGYDGLALLKAFIPLPAIVFLFVLLRRKANVYFFFLSLTLIYGISPKIYARAAGLGPIFVTLTLVIIWFYLDQKKERIFYILPLLLGIWANTHGSFLLGIAILSVFGIGYVFDYQLGRVSFNQDQVLRIGVIIFLCLMTVLFVKPFSNAKYSFPVKFFTAGAAENPSHDPIEGQKHSNSTSDKLSMPINLLKKYSHDLVIKDNSLKTGGGDDFTLKSFENPVQIFINLVILPVILIFTFLKRWKQFRLSILMPMLFILWLGLGVRRVLPYISSLIIPLLVIEIKKENKTQPLFSATTKSLLRNSVRLIVIGIICLIFYTETSSGLTNTGKVRAYYQPEAAEYVLKNYTQGSVYNSMKPGSFLLWKWWPYKKVFLQAKNVVYKKSFIKTIKNSNTLREKIKEKGFDVAILSEGEFNKGRNLFAVLPNYNYIPPPHPVSKLYIYCKC